MDFLEEAVDFKVGETGGVCSELYPTYSYSDE